MPAQPAITLGIECMARGLAIALLLLLAACGPGKATRVCITGTIAVDQLAPGTCFKPAALGELLDKPVHEGPGEAVELKLTSPREITEQTTVTTCRQYQDYKAKQWYALTSLDMAKEGWFEQVCTSIALLQSARPAKRSYLDEPKTGLGDVKLISAAILPTSGEAPAPNGAATIADLVATGKVRITSATPARLDLAYASQNVVYEELARGDFDHDGIEDMLVFMAVHAQGGTMQWSRDLVLSRTAKGVLLRPAMPAK